MLLHIQVFTHNLIYMLVQHQSKLYHVSVILINMLVIDHTIDIKDLIFPNTHPREQIVPVYHHLLIFLFKASASITSTSI